MTVLLYIMVKSKKGLKRGPPKAKSKYGGNVIKNNGGRGNPGLDAGAIKYLKLLGDPCRANLAAPAYGSMDSGYLVRIKQTISIPSNAVDGLIQFTASGAATAAGAGAMWAYGYSDTPGGSLGSAGYYTGPEFLRKPLVGAYRPVAGCMKLFYTGSELNRSGMVGSILSPFGLIALNQAIPGTSVDTLFDGSNRVARLGSEDHEVRWLPLSPEDQGYTGSGATQGNFHFDNTNIAFCYRGVPAGSLRAEVTFVYEWVPVADGGFPRPVAPPASTNSMQTILSHIGDAVSFATSPETARRVGMIANTVAGAYNAVRRVAPLMLAA